MIPLIIYGCVRPVVSMIHLKYRVSSLVYAKLDRTDRGANFGQPDATFISVWGFQKRWLQLKTLYDVFLVVLIE